MLSVVVVEVTIVVTFSTEDVLDVIASVEVVTASELVDVVTSVEVVETSDVD